MERQSTRRLALITGASSGIGAEFARALAARNYDLILVARRREPMNLLGRQLAERNGIHAEIMVADLAEEKDLGVVIRTIENSSRLEMLINNAGFGLLGDFYNSEAEGQTKMHKVHVLATLRLTHAALQQFVKRNHGGIIQVASVAGFSRVPGHASYCSTKAWMIAFTESLRLELLSLRSAVRIQALCPGFTYTEFHSAMSVDHSKMMPMKGFWMTPEFVVSQSLQALAKGKWLVIPGWRYKGLVVFLKFLPRWILNRAVIRLAKTRQGAHHGAPC